MTLRLSISTDKLTWADLIHFVDLARAHIDEDAEIETEYMDGEPDGPVLLVVDLEAGAVGTGPAIIDAEMAANYVRGLDSIIASEGDARGALRMLAELRSDLTHG